MKKLRVRAVFEGQYTQIVLVVASLAVIAFGAHSLLSTSAVSAPIIGVDTSHWNEYLNLTKAKSEKVAFQFMKATQGTTSDDATFATARKNAEAAGIIPGAYHFLNVGSGAAQCDHFLDRLNATGGTDGIMLALDVELQTSTTGASYTDVKNFLARCQPKTPGRTWVIYTGGWYWGNSVQAGHLGNPAAPAGTVLWISIYVGGTGPILDLLDKVGAQGTSGDPYATAQIKGWPEYAFRQYSASATVGGTSPIDADVTYKGLDFLKKLANIGPSDTIPPTVSVTAPKSGATIVKQMPVTLTATASDNVGVSKVSFYLDTNLIRDVTAPPYTYQWSPLSGNNPGQRTIIAKAYDAAGNVTSSTPIPITLLDTPDTTKPTVAITAPVTGAKVTVGTPVALTATAADDTAVTKVEFYVDNVLASTDTTSPYAYSWPTTGLAPGAHAFVAKAYDGTGNVGASTAVSVTLQPPPDTTKPTVAITAPTAGATATIGSPVALSATASDNTAVTKVEFYADSGLVSTDTVSPYSYSWPTTGVTAGIHTLSAKAYDAAGNVTDSAPVSMTLISPATAVPGDTNGDGRVNATDLSAVISHDGQDYPAADFNKDGIVGAADMAILLAHWTW